MLYTKRQYLIHMVGKIYWALPVTAKYTGLVYLHSLLRINVYGILIMNKISTKLIWWKYDRL